MIRKSKQNSKLIIGLIILSAYLSYSYITGIYKSYEVKIQEKNLKKEIEKLKSQNNDIIKQLDYITTPSFIEREAKRELDLKKPGEEVLIIKGDKNIIQTEIPEEFPEWMKMSNSERWILYFTQKNK